MMPESQLRATGFAAIIMIILGFSLLWSQQIESNPIILKPIKTVYPKYPDHLKKEGIAGEVIVWAWIDEQGDVKIQYPATIIRSLHPELDKLAIEAAKQWKYAPPLTLGKQRGAWTYISIIFDPGELPEAEDSAPREPLSDELLAMLDRSWEYCRKMDDIADFYLCRERISDTTKSIVNVGPAMMGSGEIEGQVITVRVGSFVPDLASPKTNRYVNDYQITSQNSRVTELRTLVKPPSNERDSSFGKKPLLFSIPISVPTRLLAPGFRDEHNYSFGEDDKILGKNCRTIKLKARRKHGVEVQKATLWIEKISGRVVQAEIEYDASAIDERILAECRQYYLVPHMRATYEYGDEKKGILFPSRSEIVLDYSQLGRANTRDTKMKLDIRYDNYRFFSVETEPRIIRSSRQGLRCFSGSHLEEF
jgi:TonB family protein